jgi:hypothetical protein
MIGWRGSQVRNPAFGDQPSRADSHLIANVESTQRRADGRRCVVAAGRTDTHASGGAWIAALWRETRPPDEGVEGMIRVRNG